ncbi:MAG TPA: hypothetical protein VH044_00120 [Polyangiaceae bacterium]|nr:hypothetical protein [Polyangiaceae bacterium]
MLHRRPLSLVLSLAGVAALATATPGALAQDVGPGREELASGVRHRPLDKDAGDNPLRGSTLTLDQSMTTQTTQIQPSAEQSYVPLYELWLSFRPRYYFDEHWSVRGRVDYTKELTNNQTTTFYREDVFLDIWTELYYTTRLDTLWQGTKASFGARALSPTSKASEANGTYVTLGAAATVLHQFEINGDEAPWFNDWHLSLNVTYQHPFTSATTPTSYGNFQYVRQDVGLDDRSILSDQLQGATVIDHTLQVALLGDLQVTPKFSGSLAAILINQWHYPVPDTGIMTTTGAVNPTPGGTLYTPNVWFIASVDYQLFDELDLSLGYYNLAGEIAPDGKRRGLFGSDNVFWSPDARVFFDITANLDYLFDDAVHHRYSQPQVGAGPRAAQPATAAAGR